MEPWAVLLYGALCCFYILFIKHRRGVCLNPFFRVLPFIVLIGSVMSVFAKVDEIMIPRPMAYYLQGLNRILYGLLFGVISNVYATMPTLHAVYRLFSLSVSFSFYILNFTQDLEIVSLQYIMPVDIVAFLVIFAVIAGVYLYIILNMNCIDRLLFLLFLIALTVFLWSAISPALKLANTRSATRLIGGCLMSLSELCYALNKWHSPNSIVELLATPLHYAAQLSIVFSAMHLGSA